MLQTGQARGKGAVEALGARLAQEATWSEQKEGLAWPDVGRGLA